MNKIVLFLCFLCGNIGIIRGQGDLVSYDGRLSYLYSIASKNLIYKYSVPEDDFLHLCQQMEDKARIQQDYVNLFLIQQIAAGFYCLNGDIGLAVNESQKMYEEAQNLNSEIGIALSIQTMGNAYMHSNQLKQALDAFHEVEERLEGVDDNFIKVRLLTQQMHVCMLMDNKAGLQQYLVNARKLLDRVDIRDKNDYIFYLQCFQTFHDIAEKDKISALINLKLVARIQSENQMSLRFYYFLSTRYYDLMADYEKALAYCDSALLEVNTQKNLNECKNLIIEKAGLLAKNNQKKDARLLYIDAKSLGDSLNTLRYAKQIDSLRVNYWVSQIEIETKAMNNKFLTWSVLGALLALIVVVVSIYLLRKKNQRLIASRKELEAIRKEAADSIQSKSLFLSNMSHELRTPLNAIVGFSDLLACDVVEDAESKQQFGDRIKQNSQLLLKLFNDVADLSGLKRNKISFTYEIYDAVAICRNVIDTVDTVKQTAASLSFKTTLDSLSIYTDSGRLQQLLINLLINATKFTQEGTITLVLKLDEERQEAVFIVEDTGCGIPLEKQPHIFERFEKLHEGIQGAGLGLSICQLIVEYVGGRIWIDSEYTGGARFIFTHPLAKTTKPIENE